MDITGNFKGMDNVNLFYRGWIPQNPSALLILIHGAGEHSGRYSYIGEGCMNHQIALVAPDLRGFGQSEGPRGHVNQFKDYLDDLEILVHILSNRYHSIPIFLFGHSLGGLVVIRYGQTYPHRALGFILSSPALRLRFQMPAILKKTLEFVSRISPDLTIQPHKWMQLLKKIRQLQPYIAEPGLDLLKDPFHTTEYTPRWLSELLQSGIHASMEAAKFHFPTLCLYDQQDPIVHPDSIRQFIDSITIQDKNYIIFSEGNHRPWHGPHSQQAMESVMTWMNTRL